MTQPLNFEADVISGMDDLRDQLPPTVSDLPMDDPLFAFDKKAKNFNRYPARIQENDWISKVVTGNVVITDEFTGEPATMEKYLASPIDPADRDEIEISPALEARIQMIAAKVADGLQHSLGKATRSLAKRASSAFCSNPDLADADPHFDAGRKILSVERRGKAKITKFEGGERWEIVED